MLSKSRRDVFFDRNFNTFYGVQYQDATSLAFALACCLLAIGTVAHGFYHHRLRFKTVRIYRDTAALGTGLAGGTIIWREFPRQHTCLLCPV
jgi:hypothetical protein